MWTFLTIWMLIPATAGTHRRHEVLQTETRTRRIPMSKGRLEAFSDGVLAIIITIMVLELKIPHGSRFADLLPVVPDFLSYVLSFIYIGIYWNNHHHMLHMVQRVTGPILWANLHLLFWLSLVPVCTGWLGENSFASAPSMLYGGVLLMSAVAYFVLQQVIIRSQGEHSALLKAVGDDWKGKTSLLLYGIAVVVAVWSGPVAHVFYVVVALIWLLPDRRIERMLAG
jgi:uncharacterized membrane protein